MQSNLVSSPATTAAAPGRYLIASRALFLSVAAALALSTFEREASAQAADSSLTAENPARRNAPTALTISLAPSKIDEDWFLHGSIGARIVVPDVKLSSAGALFDEDQRHNLAFRLFAPLRLRVFDQEPEDDRVLRTEDWDEPAEYLRVLRSVEYAQPYDGIYFRFGELTNVRIGHRTIVDNYANVLHIDHFEWGGHAALNTVFGGVELMLDNFADPDIIGSRVYGRPLSFVDQESWWTRFAVGLSVVSDIDAPARLALQPDGRYVAESDGSLRVADSDPTTLLGIDLEVTVLDGDVVTLTPYTDWNHHLGLGQGLHIGTFAGFRASETVTLETRAEYRLLGDDYLPRYVGGLYEVQRFAYRTPAGADSATQRLPKLRWLRTSELGLRSGYLAEAGLNVLEILHVSGAWEDEQGPENSSLWLRAHVTALQRIRLAAYYAKENFDGLDEAFTPEDALLVAELRVGVTSWLDLIGQLNRRWRVTQEGTYEPVDDFFFGAAAGFEL